MAATRSSPNQIVPSLVTATRIASSLSAARRESALDAEGNSTAFTGRSGQKATLPRKRHTRDAHESTCYVGRTGHIAELYVDGTWSSDKAAEGSTLDEYVKRFPEV